MVGSVAPPVLKPALGRGSGFVSDVISSVSGDFIGNRVKDKINKNNFSYVKK